MEKVRITEYASPLGTLRLAGTEEGLLSLDLPRDRFPNRWQGESPGPLPCLDAAREWLDAYFKGERPDAGGIDLCPRGSDFRQRVWSLLREIPYGETVTYGELAKRIAPEKRMSAQAIGGAVGRNPIGILIPCHRVLGANGSLTGYAGGLEKKRFLLQLEGIPFRE